MYCYSFLDGDTKSGKCLILMQLNSKLKKLKYTQKSRANRCEIHCHFMYVFSNGSKVHVCNVVPKVL